MRFFLKEFVKENFNTCTDLLKFIEAYDNNDFTLNHIICKDYDFIVGMQQVLDDFSGMLKNIFIKYLEDKELLIIDDLGFYSLVNDDDIDYTFFREIINI